MSIKAGVEVRDISPKEGSAAWGIPALSKV